MWSSRPQLEPWAGLEDTSFLFDLPRLSAGDERESMQTLKFLTNRDLDHVVIEGHLAHYGKEIATTERRAVWSSLGFHDLAGFEARPQITMNHHHEPDSRGRILAAQSRRRVFPRDSN